MESSFVLRQDDTTAADSSTVGPGPAKAAHGPRESLRAKLLDSAQGVNSALIQLTEDEAALLLNLSPGTLANLRVRTRQNKKLFGPIWLEQGTGAHPKISYLLSDIMDYLARCRVNHRPRNKPGPKGPRNKHKTGLADERAASSL